MNAQGAYNIRLLGFPGLGPDASRAALQQAFPVDDRQAAEVVQRIPTRVKSSLARHDALRFAKVLLKLGADIEIDKAGRGGARVFRAADFVRTNRGFGGQGELGDILGLDDEDMPLRMPTSGEWPAVPSSEFEPHSGGFDDDDDDEDDYFRSYHGASDSGPSLAALLGDGHGRSGGGSNGWHDDRGDERSARHDSRAFAGSDEPRGPAAGISITSPAPSRPALTRSPVEPPSEANPFRAPSITVARLDAAKRSGLFSLDEIVSPAPSAPAPMSAPSVTESGTEIRFDQLLPPKPVAPSPEPAPSPAPTAAAALPPEDEAYRDSIKEQTGHSFRGPTPGPNALAAVQSAIQSTSVSHVATPGGKLTFSSAALDSVVCPNCGAEQAVAEVCSRCASGLIDVRAVERAEGRAQTRASAPSLEVEIVPSGGLAGPRIIDPTPRYRTNKGAGPSTTGEATPSQRERAEATVAGRRVPLVVAAVGGLVLAIALVVLTLLGLGGGGRDAVVEGGSVRDPVGGGAIEVRFPASAGAIAPIETLDLRRDDLELREAFSSEGEGDGAVSTWYLAVSMPEATRADVAGRGGSALTELLGVATAPLGLRVGDGFPTRTGDLPTLEVQVRRNRQDVGRFRAYALRDELIVTGYARADGSEASEQAGLRFLDSFSYSGPAPRFE
jgi:hypothetical protein